MAPIRSLTALSIAWAICLIAQLVSSVSAGLSVGAAIKDRATALAPTASQPGTSLDPFDGVVLHESVILATVDGKFHAVDRKSGKLLWSMADPAAPPDTHSVLHNLVRTKHLLSSEDDEDAEMFIVEPQTGDIYVLPQNAPLDEPLRRLPFSVPTLVELSPFSFSEDHRVFVGGKETSLIGIELETGRIVEAVTPGAHHVREDEGTANGDAPLNDSEDPQPKAKPTIVYIGRTHYHVSVLVKNQVTQNLSFSAYGPDNRDQRHQELWTATPDNYYLQPLHDGKVFGFRLNDDSFQNYPSFEQQVVAVFDVLSTPQRDKPIVLLQPRPLLNEAFPRSYAQLRDVPDRTFVGIVGKSLFAMSNSHFPLITFADIPRRTTVLGRDSGDDNLETRVASVLDKKCRTIDCFVGARLSVDDRRLRFPKLIEGPEKRDLRAQEPLNTDSQTEAPSTTSPENAKQTLSDAFAKLHNDREQDKPPPRRDDRHGPERPDRRPGPPWSAIASFAVGFVLIWMVLRVAIVQLLHKPVLPTTAPGDVRRESHTATETAPLLGAPQTPTTALAIAAASFEEEKRAAFDGENGGDDQDGDSDREEGTGAGAAGGKRRPRRKRGRGKKKQGLVLEPVDEQQPVAGPSGETSDGFVKVDGEREVQSKSPISFPTPTSPGSLVVSEAVLGYGSHGTVVFRGSLQGRPVAVKRLLQDFVTLASHEVSLLQDADDHPNVIRYYYKEFKDNFLYIALELCPASLAEIIERPNDFQEISAVFDPKRALMQITAGLRHLHLLKIVHRDIKPQNILVSRAKNGVHRMLISDFGLCKKLESDQTSFLPTAHGALAAGTVGWRALEIIRGEVKLDEETGMDEESGGVTNPAPSAADAARLTKSVDIFALGCLFYYVISNGDHPFGDKFERESNILKNVKYLDGLEQFGEEGAEARDLMTAMLDPDPRKRPDTSSCLIHPFFWNPARRLAFLQDASDRFEIMERDPRETGLIALETNAIRVVGSDWHRRLDKVFIENLGKFRKYDGSSVQDLLRALRNKKHHYQDLPEHVKRHMGPLPEGFLAYFTRRFPALFLHVYGVIANSPLRYEAMFRTYFQLAEP